MTYLQRNKKQNKGIKIILGVLVVLVLFRILNVPVLGFMFQNTFNYVLESRIGVFAPIQNSVAYFQSKKDLSEKNDSLKKTNIDLKLELLTKQIIDEEFELFKKQFIDENTDKKVYKVILKPPFMPFDLLRIAGDFNQYNEGDLVFYQKVVIGSIIERTNLYATVQLFSSPDKVTSASINGTQFEARGLGGGRFVIEISKDFEVEVGDAIAYPFEQVILLGVVGEIESIESDLFKKVYFNTPTPLESISYVTIGI